MMTAEKDRLEIEFDLDWDLVVRAQKFMIDFFRLVLLSKQVDGDEIGISLSTVLTELLENVMKYAVRAPGKVVLEVDQHAVHIRVENYASSENISIIQSEYSIVSRGDARQAYALKMLSKASEDDQTSRLGLARIRVESMDGFQIQTEADKIVATVRYRF